MREAIAAKIEFLKRPWLLTLAIIFFILLISLIVGLIVFDKKFKNKIYPNIYIGELNLGGKTEEETKKLLNSEIDKIRQSGIIFSQKETKAILKPMVTSPDGGLAYSIIDFDYEKAANDAATYGRSGNFWKDSFNKLALIFKKRKITLSISANQLSLEKFLTENFSFAYEPARDASLDIKYNQDLSSYEFSVSQEKIGRIIDYQEAIGKLINNLGNLDAQEIKLYTITEYPKIFSSDCLNIPGKAQAVLNSAPIILKYKEKQWKIEQAELSQMITLKSSGLKTDKVMVGLDEKKFKDYLATTIAPEIDQETIEAKFQMNNGKVSEFQGGQDGLKLNQAATLAKIENEFMSKNEIDLVVETQSALSSVGDINYLGIKEIIGVGTSNFSGSPVNRRHNIKVGAASVNGTLIKPGEEFSLLKVLGEVTGSTGYLPELVIKEGKTTPEYGGGLCQIGTTVFRAALSSGLNITLRRNHSYRVSYYEPAGTDATIYDPWPDFRFINDTANHILIQSKFSGDNLSFEFWGTRDARTVEQTKPVIYNIVKPGPTKLIETLDLKPGEKKCTEHAHNGADAYFDYKVTYADGTIKKERFSSHYVPWREVCLIGVEKLSVPAEESPGDMASSTPVIN